MATAGSSSAQRALVFFHGLGDEGASWDGQLQIMLGEDVADSKPTVWVFPDAPMVPVTVNGGEVMPSWFDLPRGGIPVTETTKDAEADMLASADACVRIVQRLKEERGIPASCVVLGGFSQGAVVALLGALRCPDPVAGVACVSGWVPLRSKLASLAANKEGLATVRVWSGHGTADNVVRFADARRGYAWLHEQRLFHSVSTVDVPRLAHSVTPDEMRSLGLFLARECSW